MQKDIDYLKTSFHEFVELFCMFLALLIILPIFMLSLFGFSLYVLFLSIISKLDKTVEATDSDVAKRRNESE